MRLKEEVLQKFLDERGWKFRDLVIATYPLLSSDILYKVIKAKTRKPGTKVAGVLMKVTGMSFEELFEIEENGEEVENVYKYIFGSRRSNQSQGGDSGNRRAKETQS